MIGKPAFKSKCTQNGCVFCQTPVNSLCGCNEMVAVLLLFLFSIVVSGEIRSSGELGLSARCM